MTADPQGSQPARASVLAREMGEFLIELAIALQKHAMYPSGHPALGAVSGRVLDRLGTLMEQRPSLSLGVARTQLVIEGIATDAAHPVLRQLALRFHDHHLAALRFERGVEEWELVELLASLAPDPATARAEPLGLGRVLPSWPHVRLAALGLGDLEVVDGEAGDGTLGSRLWLDLARAALAAEEGSQPVDPDEMASPSVVARAIDQRSGTGTYDQVIAGYLIEITRSVRSAELADAAPLIDRVGRLIRELSPETLRRLMTNGGDRIQQRAFLQEATAGLPVDTALRLLTATSDVAGHPLSELLLRMYEKLSMHATAGPAPVAARAGQEFRSHVQALVQDWEMPTPNPASYDRALAGMASTRPLAGDGAGGDVASADAERLLQMCLELDVIGEAMERPVDRLLSDGRADVILALVDAAPPSRTTAAVSDRLGRPERLPLLLEARVETARLVPLVERMGEAAPAALLDVLLASEDRGVRRRTFDLLLALGPRVATAVDRRFDGETRWYALRNLLALHHALGTRPATDVAVYAAHEDGRVRREAYKLLLGSPDHARAALLGVLEDPDPLVVQLVTSSDTPLLDAGVVGALERRATEARLGEPVRAALVRTLAPIAEPEARDALLRLAAPGRTLFGRPRLDTTPVGLAALRVLATRWADDATAADLLDRARGHRDAAAQAAARGEGEPT